MSATASGVSCFHEKKQKRKHIFSLWIILAADMAGSKDAHTPDPGSDMGNSLANPPALTWQHTSSQSNMVVILNISNGSAQFCKSSTAQVQTS